MRLAPGAMVSPALQLVAQIGEGGMGQVWEAWHHGYGCEVAIKFALSRDPEILQRFEREVDLTARIASAHVVRTFEHAETDTGTPYLVMERLRGQNLAERLRAGPLDAYAASWLLWQICDAVGRAHAGGVIHRDLKPDNVYLVEPPPPGAPLFVKLLDFGLSRANDPLESDEAPLTRMGSMMGTPTYMSPEQLKDARAVDLRSDLWAIGVIVYEALSGAPPFAARDLPSLLMSICRGQYEPIAARLGLPAKVDGWIARALCLDRERRFQSIAEVTAGWQDAFRTESSAPPPSTMYRQYSAAAAEADDLNRTVARVPDVSGVAPASQGAPASYYGERSDIVRSPDDDDDQPTNMHEIKGYTG